MYTVAIVTSSDKGSKGEREDKSGAVIREIVEKSGFQVKRYVVLPDEKELLKEEFRYLADELGVNLVLSTGGTGFSPRDITPEATKEIVERETAIIVSISDKISKCFIECLAFPFLIIRMKKWYKFMPSLF